jgi:fatty acid desaturase
MQDSTSYSRGWRAQLSASAKQRMIELHRTSFWRCAGRGLVAHAIILAALLFFGITQQAHPAIAWAALVPIGLLVAREQRVLELLVHNAAHSNWTRNRKLNDIAATWIAALPGMNSVASYRASHNVHHKEYGSSVDPDRVGFAVLGRLDLTKPWAAAGWMLRYAVQYYRMIGSAPLLVAGFLAWHACFYILPMASVLGIGGALLTWLAGFLLPMMVILQVLRAIAESEEHDYALGSTEFETTISNGGPMHHLFFHPWNDNYHLLHHLYPAMPQFNHVAANRILREEDPNYVKRPLRLQVHGAPVYESRA